MFFFLISSTYSCGEPNGLHKYFILLLNLGINEKKKSNEN